MSRLIDADEVKKYYETRFPEIDNGVHWSRNDIIMNLDNIETADIAPVIRCKDCIYWEEYCRIVDGVASYHVCSLKRELDGTMHRAKSDDYCSWAKRAE